MVGFVETGTDRPAIEVLHLAADRSPRGESGQAAGILAGVCFVPMLFFAGMWLPRAEMPEPLREVSNFTPLGAAVQAIQTALLNGFPPISPLLVLPACAVIFGAMAVLFFRWE